MKFIQYDTQTGFIMASNSIEVQPEYLPPNVGQLPVEDAIDIGIHHVNLATREIEPIQ
jgi:hypothetical protein